MGRVTKLITRAGIQNVIMVGPPGSGKTMLTKRLPGILLSLSLEEALETTKIHSVVGKIENNSPLVNRSPFMDTHHMISGVTISYYVMQLSYSSL